MSLRPCRMIMVNDGDGYFDEMDEYHPDGRYYYRDDVDEEIKVLRARLAKAERALGVAAEAIEERCSGLAGDPLQPVADLIGNYYRDTRATDVAADRDASSAGAVNK